MPVSQADCMPGAICYRKDKNAVVAGLDEAFFARFGGRRLIDCTKRMQELHQFAQAGEWAQLIHKIARKAPC